MPLPKGWDSEAQADWEAKRHGPAIGRVLALLELAATPGIALQAGYYLFTVGDFGRSRQVLEAARQQFPDNLDLLLNLAVLQAKTQAHAEVRATLEHYIELGGDDPNAFDGLCAACHRTGDDEAARSWGRKAIDEKTRRAEQTATKHKLGKPRKRGRRIIAFSLWGNNPRYLRGALHNQLVAARLYPGFTCRFYVDSSVPADLLAALELNGAELVHDEAEPTQRRRLTRRFHVADDPAVAVHLVRDCDSVLNPREAGAVTQWLESGKPIHVMRDWWTHTDPMLAGMWGGLGGVLPPLEPLLAAYNPRVMETANWDQWFLRDRIWALVRPVAMVHDRLFGSEGSQPFPGPQPTGNVHVGQDEYAVRRDKQAGKLALFKASVPSLEL